MAQKRKSSEPAEPKKRGRDWGFLLFIAGILLIAIGTQISTIVVVIGIACIVAVILGILFRMFKQLYY